MLQAGCIDVGVHADVYDEVDIDVDVNVYSDVNAFLMWILTLKLFDLNPPMTFVPLAMLVKLNALQ